MINSERESSILKLKNDAQIISSGTAGTPPESETVDEVDRDSSFCLNNKKREKRETREKKKEKPVKKIEVEKVSEEESEEHDNLEELISNFTSILKENKKVKFVDKSRKKINQNFEG